MKLRIPAWIITGILLIAVGAFYFFSRGQTTAVSPAGEAYRIESIEMPEGLTAEVGGLGFMPDGRLVACFHRGEVMTYEAEKKEWKLFADGLHDTL